MKALETSLASASDIQVLKQVMCLERIRGLPPTADELANHIILVCLDCEHWSNNTDETTEVGFANVKRTELLPVVANGDLGDHGEHLLKQVKYSLLRIKENSHLPCQNPVSQGVAGNRFGKGRFVSLEEARQVMTDVFVQPLNNIDGLGFGNSPVVVLGQDIGHDKNNLAQKSVSFDIEKLGTVVRWIDTQVLAREVGYWLKPKNEQIGLARLVQELWFEHSDPHTAANDAARTIISAFQLALGNHPCKKNARKSMLDVATELEAYSVANFQSIGGEEEYCWRCGKSGHMKPDCTATDLFCEECSENACVLEKKEEHVTMHCLCIAKEKAVVRRAKDAQNRLLRKAKPPHLNTRGRSGLPSQVGRAMAPPPGAYCPFATSGPLGGGRVRGFSGGCGF
jgi:hypothetical protein